MIERKRRVISASDHEASEARYLSNLEGNGVEILCLSSRIQLDLAEERGMGTAFD